jgi:hypothetical protein
MELRLNDQEMLSPNRFHFNSQISDSIRHADLRVRVVSDPTSISRIRELDPWHGFYIGFLQISHENNGTAKPDSFQLFISP